MLPRRQHYATATPRSQIRDHSRPRVSRCLRSPIRGSLVLKRAGGDLHTARGSFDFNAGVRAPNIRAGSKLVWEMSNLAIIFPSTNR